MCSKRARDGAAKRRLAHGRRGVDLYRDETEYSRFRGLVLGRCGINWPGPDDGRHLGSEGSGSITEFRPRQVRHPAARELKEREDVRSRLCPAARRHPRTWAAPVLPSGMNTPWAGSDSYKDFGAQYHSQPDGHARSVHPRVLSVYASTLDFGGVTGYHSLCRPYTNAATLDTEPLARSTPAGFTPACHQTISSSLVNALVMPQFCVASWLSDYSDMSANTCLAAVWISSGDISRS